MHEVSLCENVIDIIKTQAAIEKFTHVKTVFLAIGQLSCVEPEAMKFAFSAVAKDTCAEGAALEIEHIAGQAKCDQCGHIMQIAQRYEVCSKCSHYPLIIESGDFMRITYLEVE